MAQYNRDDLYKLSNQMIDLFVNDVFTRNKTNLDKAKTNITNEQRKSLKESLHHLQTQVESFVNEQKASKTVTEEDQKQNNESLSPLREKLNKKTKTKSDVTVDDSVVNEEKEE